MKKWINYQDIIDQSLYSESLVYISFSSMGISKPVKLPIKEFVITTETISEDSSSGYRMDTVWRIFIAAFENGSFREGKRFNRNFCEL